MPYDEVGPGGDRPALEDPGPGAPTDPELVAACLRGDVGAWEALVGRYADLVYTAACRGGLNEDEAAEVFCETWDELWGRLSEVRHNSRLGPWLLTVSARLVHRSREPR